MDSRKLCSLYGTWSDSVSPPKTVGGWRVQWNAWLPQGSGWHIFTPTCISLNSSIPWDGFGLLFGWSLKDKVGQFNPSILTALGLKNIENNLGSMLFGRKTAKMILLVDRSVVWGKLAKQPHLKYKSLLHLLDNSRQCFSSVQYLFSPSSDHLLLRSWCLFDSSSKSSQHLSLYIPSQSWQEWCVRFQRQI
jgi:hypothetical protein